MPRIFKLSDSVVRINLILSFWATSVHFLACFFARRNLKKYPIISGFPLISSECLAWFRADSDNRPDTAMLSPKFFEYRRIFISTAEFLALNACESFCSAEVSA